MGHPRVLRAAKNDEGPGKGLYVVRFAERGTDIGRAVTRCTFATSKSLILLMMCKCSFGDASNATCGFFLGKLPLPEKEVGVAFSGNQEVIWRRPRSVGSGAAARPPARQRCSARRVRRRRRRRRRKSESPQCRATNGEREKSRNEESPRRKSQS